MLFRSEEFLRKQVDAAIFDIGNVLIDFAWQDYMKSLDFDRVTYEHVADAMFRSEDWDQGEMANTLARFKKYTDKLDEVYQNAAVTAVLDGDGALVQMGANAGEMVIPKISMDGLADYSRSGGYVAGDVTLSSETVQFHYDRGRVFTVDAMDDEETAGVAFGRLAGEFVRTRVAPEMDAFRFAAYASHSGIGKKAGRLSGGDEVLAALLEGQNAKIGRAHV